MEDTVNAPKLPPTTNVAKYNINTEKWEKMPPLKEGRRYHGCSLYPAEPLPYIIVAGGDPRPGTTELYPINGKGGEVVGDLHQGRYYLGLLTVPDTKGQSLNPKVYAIGGAIDINGNQYFKSIEQWQASTRTWLKTLIELATPRWGFGAVALKDTMICKDSGKC